MCLIRLTFMQHWSCSQSRALAQIGTKMAKYEVIVTMEKTVIVNAIDEEEARQLAEIKVNKTSNKWTAEKAWAVA